MKKHSSSFRQAVLLLTGVSSLAMLAACGGTGAKLKNPFSDDRSPQRVEGMRRIPPLNPTQQGAAPATMQMIPAPQQQAPAAPLPLPPQQVAPPPPPAPAAPAPRASYESNPFEYFDDSGKAVEPPPQPSDSKSEGNFFSRLFSGDSDKKAAVPAGPRKAFPSNPNYQRAPENIAPPPPPPVPLERETVSPPPQVEPYQETFSPPPPPPPPPEPPVEQPVYTPPPAPAPVVMAPPPPAPIAEPQEDKSPLPAASQALPWTGTYIPYDEEVPEEEYESPKSDMRPLLGPRSEAQPEQPRTVASPLRKSWFERNFGSSFAPVHADPRTFEDPAPQAAVVQSPGPVDDTTLETSGETNWAEPQPASSSETKPTETAATDGPSWMPGWLSGDTSKSKTDSNLTYPSLSSVPPAPPEFEAVKSDQQQNMENLQSDYIEALQDKQMLDSEPSQQEAATPVEVPPAPKKEIVSAPATVTTTTTTTVVTPTTPGQPVLLGRASAPLEPTQSAAEGEAQAPATKPEPYWRSSLSTSLGDEEDENADGQSSLGTYQAQP